MQEDVNPIRAEFIRRLSALTGNTFQETIVQLLLRRFASFQAVPTKPHGDGGIDGLSHNQTRAYCCYGLEYVPTDTKKEIRKKICDKFRDDLRRIFEVKPGAKASTGRKFTLEHDRNQELEFIIATGARLMNIHLVVNQYEDNTILNPLHTDFKLCLQSSQCRFVDRTCELTVWGPKERRRARCERAGRGAGAATEHRTPLRYLLAAQDLQRANGSLTHRTNRPSAIIRPLHEQILRDDLFKSERATIQRLFLLKLTLKEIGAR